MEDANGPEGGVEKVGRLDRLRGSKALRAERARRGQGVRVFAPAEHCPLFRALDYPWGCCRGADAALRGSERRRSTWLKFITDHRAFFASGSSLSPLETVALWYGDPG